MLPHSRRVKVVLVGCTLVSLPQREHMMSKCRRCRWGHHSIQLRQHRGGHSRQTERMCNPDNCSRSAQATNTTMLAQPLGCCPARCFMHALTVMVWLGLQVRLRLTTKGASAVLADTQVDGIVPHWASWVPAGAKAGVGGRVTAGPLYAGLSATPRGRMLDESPGLGAPEPAMQEMVQTQPSRRQHAWLRCLGQRP